MACASASSLARALAATTQAARPRPSRLLMDEPFAALDAITRDVLQGELLRVWEATGTTILFVTHDVREAVRLAERVVLLSSRPGTGRARVAGRRRPDRAPRRARRDHRTTAGGDHQPCGMTRPPLRPAGRPHDAAGGRRRPGGRRGGRRGARRPRHADRHDTALVAAGAGARGCRRSWRSLLFLVVWQLVWASAITDEYKLPGAGRRLARVHGDRGRRPGLVDPLDLDQPGLRSASPSRWSSPPRWACWSPRSSSSGPPSGRCCPGLQTLPSVAWVPAAVLWFGLTDAMIYFVVLLGAVPSIANGLVAGIDQVPPLLPRVGQVLGARGLTSARHILLPAALPGYLAGLQAGLGLLLALADGRGDHRRRPVLGFGLGELPEAGQRLQRHAHGHRRDLPDPGRRHRRSSCWCSGPSSGACCASAGSPRALIRR